MTECTRGCVAFRRLMFVAMLCYVQCEAYDCSLVDASTNVSRLFETVKILVFTINGVSAETNGA